MLVSIIFSFSHNVFKVFLSHGHKESGLYGKVLSFNNPEDEAFLKNIVEKGENVGKKYTNHPFSNNNLSSANALNLVQYRN